MVALTADRSTVRRENADIETHPVKAGAKIFQGALVCLDASGWAQPGATATTLTALGRAEYRADNSGGGNGDVNVAVRRGVLCFANSGSGDLITRADIGKPAYVVDDQTLAKTNGGGTRSAAGIIRDADAQSVWIEI